MPLPRELARTLSLKQIYKRGEDQAYQAFKKLRWAATDGNPVCPKCGCLDHYEISTRRKFKCASCHAQFSVTSGTIFASRKLGFMDLLGAIYIFVNAAKGLSALQLSRDLDVQYKTAWGLARKLREALSLQIQDEEPLDGNVEVDGAYFGGHIRPHNIAEKRVARRRAEHQTRKRRVVVAFRERNGRTRPFVTMSEAQGVELAKRHVHRLAIMHADKASHWDILHAGWETERVNHSKTYRDHTNWVESYFSRLRRMVTG